MVEINPLAQLEDGSIMCMDAKFGFDDNAEWRQPEIFSLRDTTQEVGFVLFILILACLPF